VRGRPPKPTRLKLLAGNPGKRKLPNEPKPEQAKRVPSPPKDLGAIAKAEWWRVAPELHRSGILTLLDHGLLRGYCQCYARWKECERIVTEQGMTFHTEKGYVVTRPEVSIGQKYYVLMRQSAEALGLSPPARARLDIKPPTELDPLEEFLFGKEKGQK